MKEKRAAFRNSNRTISVSSHLAHFPSFERSSPRILEFIIRHISLGALAHTSLREFHGYNLSLFLVCPLWFTCAGQQKHIHLESRGQSLLSVFWSQQQLTFLDNSTAVGTRPGHPPGLFTLSPPTAGTTKIITPGYEPDRRLSSLVSRDRCDCAGPIISDISRSVPAFRRQVKDGLDDGLNFDLTILVKASFINTGSPILSGGCLSTGGFFLVVALKSTRGQGTCSSRPIVPPSPLLATQ